MPKIFYIFLLCCGCSIFAQTEDSRTKIKAFVVTSTSVQLDSLSISPFGFKVFTTDGVRIEADQYTVDFSEALLQIDPKRYPSIIVHFKSLPSFLTQEYGAIDKSVIIKNETDLTRLYRVQEKRTKTTVKPFNGLQTSGSLSRGLTVGNNQDAVVNSNFDLQITGNLSNDVKIRAAITDTNIPIQEQGYTQRLEEFDRVYVELFADQWSVQAGDFNLTETNHKFLRFNKKVAGLKVEANSKDERWKYIASGALVRGQFSRSDITAQEGNQGPYKVNAASAEQFIIIISGSERVYVNGTLVQRGENNAYTIDYTTAELTFNPTFPITGQMRIVVEYQFAKRNYTRFVSHDGLSYTSDNFKVGLLYYNESDLKNSPVQQDLSNNQKEILAQAGDDTSLMTIPSATPAIFEEHKILYTKEVVGGTTQYRYTTDPNEEVYTVKFNYVGEFAGSYEVASTIASGRVYRYVGLGNGAYEPIIPLIAPNNLQIFGLNAGYQPSDKMSLSADVALSNRDLNLFSNLQDQDNKGLATALQWEQVLLDKSWQLKSIVEFEWIDEQFTTVERFRPVEFFRDWDLINPTGNQQQISTELRLIHPEKGRFDYRFEQLNYSANFTGKRHELASNLKLNKTQVVAKAELVSSQGALVETTFNRWDARIRQDLGKSWVGLGLDGEQRERKLRADNRLDSISHQYASVDVFLGRGDTAKVYTEVGLALSQTDSVQQQRLTKSNTSSTIYLRSRLVQNTKASLFLFANYRIVNPAFAEREERLNARVNYNQRFAANAIQWQTAYETSAGALPRQEYSYIEVDTGQGYYTWIDYNENGIQELEEFEQAQFQDQASYLRVLLPTLSFVRTNDNKFSQSLQLHPAQWVNSTGLKRVLSKLTNQTTLQLNSKRLRSNGFNFNPFQLDGAEVLSLQSLYKNSLFFNRGQQQFSTSYTYLQHRNKSTYALGDQDLTSAQHELKFEHKVGDFWLLGSHAVVGKTANVSAGFVSRNYDLKRYEIKPKLAYIVNNYTRFEGAYAIKHKENTINDKEIYDNQTVSLDIRYHNGKSFGINATVNYIENTFKGNENSPVAYQLLEGLRPGANFTWNLGVQQKLTRYLDFTILYTGRKSADTRAIHTGSMQLRANF